MTGLDLKEINEKMDILINLIAAQNVKGLDYRDQVVFLDNAGLPPKRIARVLGKTANNVSVTLHLAKKAKKNDKQEKE